MAKLQAISSEEEQGLRLIKLLDEATNVLRNYLLQPFKNGPLTFEDALKKEERKLRNLLKNDQIDIIFPTIGGINLDECDISLLFILLRTVRKIRKPKTGWNDEPLSSDVTEPAHIVRIKIARNNVIHSRLKKNNTDYQSFRKSIGNSLVALGADISVVNRIINEPIDGNVTSLFNQQALRLSEANTRLQELEDKLEDIESVYNNEVWYSVLPLSPSFTGRQTEVKNLHQAICSNKANQEIGTIVSGLSGTGKTSLALFYCYEYRAYYKNNVVWLNADKKETLTNSFFELASYLKITESSESTSIIVSRVYKFFSNRDVLFCFDNANDLDVVLDFLPLNLPPTMKKPFVLITSTISKWSRQFHNHVITMLTDKESIEFISCNLPSELISSQESLLKLCNTIKGYVIALQQGVSFMKYNMIDTDDYLTRISKVDIASLLSFPVDDYFYKKTFYESMIITLEMLVEQKSTKALEILNVISFLDGLRVDKLLLSQSNLCTSAELDEHIMLLDQLSLIVIRRNYREKEVYLTVHSLVQLVIRDRVLKSKHEGFVISNVFEIFDNVIAEKSEKSDHFEFGLLWIHHVVHIHLHLQDTSSLIADQISSRVFVITNALVNIHNYKLAISILEDVEKFALKMFSEKEYFLCKLRLLVRSRKFREGLIICEKISELMKNNNTNSNDYFSFLFHKAFCFSGIGQHKEALALYRTLYKLEAEEKGETDSGTLVTQNNIAYEQAKLGKYEEAIQTLNDTLQKYRSTNYFQKDENFYLAFDNLGQFLTKAGKFEKAVDVFHELLYGDMRNNMVEFYGKENSTTLCAKIGVSTCYYNLGRYQGLLTIAVELEDDVKEVYEKFGYGHMYYNGAKNFRGNALLRLGRYNEAYKTYLELRDCKDPESEVDLINELNISTTLQCMGLYKKALTMYNGIREQFKTKQFYFSLEHDKMRADINTAVCLVEFGSYKEALLLLCDLKKKNLFSEADLYNWRIYIALADCHFAMGCISKAKKNALYVTKVCKHVCKWNMDRVKAKIIIAKCKFYEKDSLDNNLKKLDELIEDIKPELGTQHPFVLDAMFIKSLICFHQSKIEESWNLLKSVMDGREQVLGFDHPHSIYTRFKFCLFSSKPWNNLIESIRPDETLKQLQDLYDKQCELLSETHTNLLIMKSDIENFSMETQNKE